MKETDVRQHIESFLKRTAREMIIPASMGLSLGLSGCIPGGVYDYGTSFSQTDASTYADAPVAIVPYGGSSMPDASAHDAGVDVAVLDARMDAGVSEAATDALAPDAGVDEGIIDGKKD